MRDDEFELYDLAVVVEAIEGHCTCSMRVGDSFFVRGGKLSLPDGADFCLYALQAVIPPSGQEGRSEALEHRMEHMIMRKQEQVDALVRACRGAP